MNEYEEMQEVEVEAEATAVADMETEGEVGQDEVEFTDTGAEETEVAEPSSDSEDDANAETDSEDDAQVERDDTFQAEKRRQREEKEAAIRKRIEEEAYRKGIIEAVGGVNPYTGEAITDKADVDEYLLMKELDKQGKDPISDYAKAVKEKQKAQVETKRTENNRAQELSEFAGKYPNVNVTELLKNERFCKFAGKRVGHESLATVYGDYLTFTNEINATVDKKVQIKAKATAAKAKASPGSLAGNGETAKVSYANMSEEAFEKKLAKVLRGEERI
jgi:hypothetical protein